MKNDLIKYYIQHMSSKELIYELFNAYEIPFKKNSSYEKLAECYGKKKKNKLNIDILRKNCRDKWKFDLDLIHLKNLKSGLLKGHSWHGAMPSMLHLSMQNKVRECIKGNISMKQLLSIGNDIMKHEYYMVAVHDLCESAIVKKFPGAIPPVRSKSISDFVFNGIPYDLKITNFISDYTKKYISKNKKKVSKELFEKADADRIRKQAASTLNDWGLNKFYVLVKNQDLWLKDPESVLRRFVNEAKKLDKPVKLKIDNKEILIQIIVL